MKYDHILTSLQVWWYTFVIKAPLNCFNSIFTCLYVCTCIAPVLIYKYNLLLNLAIYRHAYTLMCLPVHISSSGYIFNLLFRSATYVLIHIPYLWMIIPDFHYPSMTLMIIRLWMNVSIWILLLSPYLHPLWIHLWFSKLTRFVEIILSTDFRRKTQETFLLTQKEAPVIPL